MIELLIGVCVGLVFGFIAGRLEGEEAGRMEERGRTIRAALDRELETTVDLVNSGLLNEGSPRRN
jgi:hypothetical protein